MASSLLLLGRPATPRATLVQYNVDIKDLGKYTLLPYVVQAAVGGLSGYAADALIERGASIKTTRRTLQVRL